jgi:hypothetical protein
MSVPALQTVFDELARTGRVQARGVPLRVERTDGSMVEGEFEAIRDSALRIFVVESQETVTISPDLIARLWVREVVAARRWIYLGSAILAGLAVVGISALLPWRPISAGALLGTAVILTVLLAGWFPPLFDWLVVWRVRYPD